ncbi:hypothetical protein AMC90_CH01787 [Rhizobium phaseoli]|uniref:hypothetical protein n=1 Tax=Rhizobium phaseoli TaxID=396 RepID=UPI0007EB5C6B|nr:hypothetical protein [Rhizobium phaseoli]ANL27625.1 hypothetical protein AMC90_CH01787 [Rhizobium phaseoli]
MENLWPNDLLANVLSSSPNAIETILELQALGLGPITGGLVVGRVRDRSFRPNRAWSLYIEPVDQPSKSHEFLIIRSVDGKYPVVVEAYHLGESRLKRCDSKASLTKALQKIFAEPSSRSLIRVLADEAIAAGSVAHPHGETQVPSARPIELSPLFDTPDGQVASISMFGISGHISDTTLENLRDRNRHAVEPLSDRYVVSIPFVGTVKATVSKEELAILVSQAKQSLSGR